MDRPTTLDSPRALAGELSYWFRCWVAGTSRNRRGLARRAQIATSTAYSCFDGRRVPHETTLGRVLRAMDVPAPDRLRILHARQLLVSRSLRTGGGVLGAWPLAGDARDGSGYGRDLRPRGAARVTAEGLDLSGGHASTREPVIDTSGPFTIAARALLRDLSPRFAAVVSQDGLFLSGVSMLYSNAEGPRWCLTMHPVDVPDPIVHIAVRAESPVGVPARAGVWTHLAGTYSPEAGAMTLYVDGRFAASAAMPAMWAARGSFCVGRGMWDGLHRNRWPGLVRDVRAWGECLGPAAVREVAEAG